jgi:hypothetical protein
MWDYGSILSAPKPIKGDGETVTLRSEIVLIQARWIAVRALAMAAACAWSSLAGAAPGEVTGSVEILAGAGGFTGPIGSADFFGTAVASVGDLDDDGGSERGAVWMLFLDSNGSVKAHQKISELMGGFGAHSRTATASAARSQPPTISTATCGPNSSSARSSTPARGCFRASQ